MSITHTQLQTLRKANTARIPRFKNATGARVHNSDGSDWSLEQWFAAMMGELGEVVEAETGTDRTELGYELADVVIYLDLLAFRWGVDLIPDKAHTLLFGMALAKFVQYQGLYANRVKKMRRGELEYSADEIRPTVANDLSAMLAALESMAVSSGINLWQSVVEKFNRVSERVSAGVFIRNGAVEIVPDGAESAPRTVEIPLRDLIEECTGDGRRIYEIEETIGDQGPWHTWYELIIRHPDHGLLSYMFGRPNGDGEPEWGDAGPEWGDGRKVTCTRVRAVNEMVVRTRYVAD